MTLNFVTFYHLATQYHKILWQLFVVDHHLYYHEYLWIASTILPVRCPACIVDSTYTASRTCALVPRGCHSKN